MLGLAPATAQARWEQLGCQKVGFTTDKDVVRVGRGEGRFNAIRLRVAGNKVHMMDLKVVYANGQPDDIQVREEIRAGGQTRPLDLKGERAGPSRRSRWSIARSPTSKVRLRSASTARAEALSSPKLCSRGRVAAPFLCALGAQWAIACAPRARSGELQACIENHGGESSSVFRLVAIAVAGASTSRGDATLASNEQPKTRTKNLV